MHKQTLNIRIDWIKELLIRKNQLVYFKSYIVLLGLVKNHGGNLPSIEICSLALGKTKNTTKLHLKKLLQLGWIRINEEKKCKFTIVGIPHLHNLTNRQTGICALVDYEFVASLTQQEFNAYLSEFVFDGIQRTKIYKKKSDYFEGAFDRFMVDFSIRIYLGKSFITKNNKLRFVWVEDVKVGELIEHKVRVGYFDFTTQDISCLSFIKDEKTLKECVVNFNLKVSELAEFGVFSKSMTSNGGSEDKLKIQMSYTYRGKAVGKSTTTVKNYQKHYPDRYIRRENSLVKRKTSLAFEECEQLNAENLLNGKFLKKGTTIFYSHCTIRKIDKIDLKRA